jgi:hypothetical protein
MADIEDVSSSSRVTSASTPAAAGRQPSTAASTGSTPGSSEARAGVLEEVIVTAQKRDSRLEDTPVAVSAFTPESIERDRILSIEDIALRAPSMSFVQFNKGEAYISIRGTLVNTPGAGWDDSVTTFIDDVPMTGAGDKRQHVRTSIDFVRDAHARLYDGVVDLTLDAHEPVGNQAKGVAHIRRPQERQHQIGPVGIPHLPSVCPKSLSCFSSPKPVAGSNTPPMPTVVLTTRRATSLPKSRGWPWKMSLPMVLVYPRLPKKFVTPVRTGRGVTLT